MLPKPALLSSIEVPEPALSLSSAGLALLRVLAVSMYFIGTIPDNGTTQPALYRPPHCTNVIYIAKNQVCTVLMVRYELSGPPTPPSHHELLIYVKMYAFCVFRTKVCLD